jgi:hypothetical protein
MVTIAAARPLIVGGVLPPITSDINFTVNPERLMIHFRLASEDGKTEFYIAEGQTVGGEFLVWGFLIKKDFAKFPLRVTAKLAALEKGEWVANGPALFDERFQPQDWASIYDVLSPKKKFSY